MRLSTVPALLVTVLSLTAPVLSAPSSNGSSKIESRELRQIYAAAREETGILQVAWGGDVKSNGTATAFNVLFPDIKVNVTTDLSKYHDSHTDRAYLATGRDMYDLVFLQTLHDYPRWKKQGRLMQYKVNPWNQVYDQLKDKDGYYLGCFFYAFGSIIYNEDKLPAGVVPTTFKDFIKPELKGKLVLTYPNDDDAVTYLFAVIIEKYGWSWFTSLMAQNVQWVRGSGTPGAALANPANAAAISFTTVPNGQPNIKVVEPKDQYMTWPQHGAIFASTKMPETAKLFMSWAMGDDYQRNNARFGVPSTRKDVGDSNPFEAEYTDPLSFGKWMSDREKVEWYKLQFESLIGTAQGLSPLED